MNIGLILGLALLFGALSASLAEIRRDFLLALAVPVLTLILALDGMLAGAPRACCCLRYSSARLPASPWRLGVHA